MQSFTERPPTLSNKAQMHVRMTIFAEPHGTYGQHRVCSHWVNPLFTSIPPALLQLRHEY